MLSIVRCSLAPQSTLSGWFELGTISMLAQLSKAAQDSDANANRAAVCLGTAKRRRRVACFVAFLVSYRPLATNILQTLGKQQHQVVRGSKIHDDGERRKPSRR